jgi:phosphohistidine phosphatase
MYIFLKKNTFGDVFIGSIKVASERGGLFFLSRNPYFSAENLPMKTLLLMRHGQSDRNILKSDIARPISYEGERETRMISRAVKRRGVIPDLVLSSNATRTIETSRIFCDALGYAHDQIEVLNELYIAGHTDYLRILSKIDDRIGSACIVGHNPSITDFVCKYTNAFVLDMMPSGVAYVEFPFDTWSEIFGTKGKTLWTLKPSEVSKRDIHP